ncbi:MAG: InlB B-repeat-containing protein, partial [Clostridia bacterium]|nr:InlB B-repeat-containing protein [Clostridia bacterium]
TSTVETKFKVTYALGYHVSTMASVPARVKDLESGAEVTLPKAPDAATGYKFTGWKIGDGENAEIKQPDEKFNVTKSVTVTAQWESLQTRYTVTYDLGTNAHADAKVPDAETELLEGAEVTLPEAPKAADGYEFTGWKIGDGENAEIKKPGKKFTVTGSVTVTAQWAEEGSVIIPEVEYVTDPDIKDNILGWWHDGSAGYYVGDGEEVTVQATISATGAVQAYTGLLTDIGIIDDFYRIRPDAAAFTNGGGNTWGGTYPTGLVIDATGWNFDNYSALFADGASIIQVVNISLEDNVVTITVTNYAGIDTELATPVTSAKYTITSTKDITEVQPFFYTDGGAAITTASAKYAKDSNTLVQFSFDNAKGDDADPDVYNIRVGTEYEFGAPERAGYTFGGWKSSDETDTKLYVKGDKITVAGALTFTAQWTADEYTVTYALGENHAEGAEAPAAVEGKHYGDTITLPAEADTPAAAAGYEFKGWKVGTDTTLKAAGTEVEIKGDVTITAVYEAKAQYTATFDKGTNAAANATVHEPITVY